MDGLRVNWARFRQSPTKMTQELIHSPAHFLSLGAEDGKVGSTNIMGMPALAENSSADRFLLGNPSLGKLQSFRQKFLWAEKFFGSQHAIQPSVRHLRIVNGPPRKEATK